MAFIFPSRLPEHAHETTQDKLDNSRSSRGLSDDSALKITAWPSRQCRVSFRPLDAAVGLVLYWASCGSWQIWIRLNKYIISCLQMFWQPLSLQCLQGPRHHPGNSHWPIAVEHKQINEIVQSKTRSQVWSEAILGPGSDVVVCETLLNCKEQCYEQVCLSTFIATKKEVASGHERTRWTLDDCNQHGAGPVRRYVCRASLKFIKFGRRATTRNLIWIFSWPRSWWVQWNWYNDHGRWPEQRKLSKFGSSQPPAVGWRS